MYSSQKIELIKNKKTQYTDPSHTNQPVTTSTIPPAISLLFDLFPSCLSPVWGAAPLSGPSLVLGDHHHHADPEQQGQDLHDGLAEAGAAHQELGQHGHCGDVDEAAGGEGQDPGGGGGAHALGQQRAGGASQRSQRRQQLQENGLQDRSTKTRLMHESWPPPEELLSGCRHDEIARSSQKIPI